jgi:hypothetical protein
MTAMHQTTKVPKLLEPVERKINLALSEFKAPKASFHQGIGLHYQGKPEYRISLRPIQY